jgi:DNA sulfur modification protein DndC
VAEPGDTLAGYLREKGKMKRQLSFFGTGYTMEDSIETTISSLRAYGAEYDHWVLAFSGGKDSTTAATVTAHAIAEGLVKPPETLLMLMSDTGMELPPLVAQARLILAEMRRRGHQVRIVGPDMEHRFFNYMLGRGVPPPGASFRWCTGQLKIKPQMDAVSALASRYGKKMLAITGVRRGESAERDRRIETVCSKTDGECGLGMWLAPSESAPYATLAPLLHWRVCHIWDWLTFCEHRHGFPTHRLAAIYGEEERRTGCIACPVASKDEALECMLRLPEWQHAEPLLELRGLWDEMRSHRWRKRKQGERDKNGQVRRGRRGASMRFGPMTMEARAHFLDRVLDVQNRAGYELITAEDEEFIRQCWADDVWPQKWTGDEVDGTAMVDLVYADATQPILEAFSV